jgi:hypothetical protein
LSFFSHNLDKPFYINHLEGWAQLKNPLMSEKSQKYPARPLATPKIKRARPEKYASKTPPLEGRWSLD